MNQGIKATLQGKIQYALGLGNDSWFLPLGTILVKRSDSNHPKRNAPSAATWPEVRASSLLTAANEGTSVARNIYITFLLFALYVAITIGGTTDDQLLGDAPVAVPLLQGVNLRVSTFYLIAPWLFLFLHFEVLLQFALLARKLRAFEDAIQVIKVPQERGRLRMQLANFPFAHWLSGGEEQGSLRLLQATIVWITIVFVPVLLLVFTELSFLPYHSVPITWTHRIVLGVDLLMVSYFWAKFIQPDGPVWRWWFGLLWRRTRERSKEILRREYWRAIWDQRRKGRLLLIFLWLTSLSFVLLVATVPGEGLEETVLSAYAPESWWIKSGSTRATCWGLPVNVQPSVARREAWKGAPKTAASYPSSSREEWIVWLPAGLSALCPTALLFHSDIGVLRWAHRSLFLPERVLIANALPLDELDRIEHSKSEGREAALSKIQGLVLDGRDLNYADFERSRLYRGKLRGAQLRGANFSEAQLQGADLTEAQLQLADLRRAQLQGANLRDAQLDGAGLGHAQLQGANLVGARLEQVDLSAANLQGSHFRDLEYFPSNLGKVGGFWDPLYRGWGGPQLRATRLRGTQLQGVDLDFAQLQGADLRWASLQGASLSGAQLQGADLRGAGLQAAKLLGAQLQGAQLSKAQFHAADLSGTQLQGADLSKAQLQGATFDTKGYISPYGLFPSTGLIPSPTPRDSGHAKSELASLNLMIDTSLGKLTRDDTNRIIDALGRSTSDQLLIRDIAKRLKDRAQQPATGFAPTRCYGEPLKGCYGLGEKSQFAQEWATFLISIGCSKRHDVQFIYRGISLHAQAIASLDYSVAQSFAARLLHPDCKGNAGSSEDDHKRLDRMLPTW